MLQLLLSAHARSALLALSGYVLWAAALAAAVVISRTLSVVAGHHRVTDFKGGVGHGPEWLQRMHRAHMNVNENLPMFAAVVLASVAVGFRESLAWLPTFIFCARLVQSITHIVSANAPATLLRATAFLLQVFGIMALAVGLVVQLTA